MPQLYIGLASIVALFFPLALMVNRVAGAIQLLLIIIGLVTAFFCKTKNGEDHNFSTILKRFWPLHLAMAAPLIAVGFNVLLSGNLTFSFFEAPLKLALFPCIFWLMLKIPFKHRSLVYWGFLLASILAVGKMIVLTDNGAHRYTTDFIPIILFALWCLIITLFAFYGSYWTQNKKWIVWVISAIALIAGLYASYISHSRSVWITIPFITIILALFLNRFSLKQKLIIGLSTIILMGAFLQFGDIGKTRLQQAQADLIDYAQNEHSDTSLGIRLQLWKGAWVLFKENPLIGVGRGHFDTHLIGLADRGVISQGAAMFPHPHNDLLFMMAQLGLFGLMAGLALYFVPAWYFMRAFMSTDQPTRALAASGLSLCAALFIHGLADVALLWRETYPIYAISIAFFMTTIIQRRELLNKH
jgi:O-antigen ligase